MGEKLDKYLSQDYIDGIKTGLRIAQDVCERNGIEVEFPDVEEMTIELKEKNKERKAA